MISSNSNESNGKSLLASLGLVGLAIMIHWCYLDFELSFLKETEEKKRQTIESEEDSNQDHGIGDDPNELDSNIGNKSDDGSAEAFYFPWEPNYEPHDSGKNYTQEWKTTSLAATSESSKSSPSMAFRSHHGRHKTQAKEQSQKEQLEFLASMTFANGGLRSPSCPCCI